MVTGNLLVIELVEVCLPHYSYVRSHSVPLFRILNMMGAIYTPKYTSKNAATPKITVTKLNTETIFISDQPHISK